MPVPVSINDLSTTASSNSPAGTETPTEGDNYIRTLSAFIAQLRDMLNGTSGSPTVLTLTVTNDLSVAEDLTVSGDASVGALTSGGVVTVPALHNASNLLGPMGPPAQAVKSGTYTPTPSLITNASAATGLALQYMQVGLVVTCSGRISITPTVAASTFTQVEIDPPIGTNFASLNECGGTGSFITAGGTQIPIRIEPNTTTDKVVISFLAPQSTAMLCNVHFTYLVN